MTCICDEKGPCLYHKEKGTTAYKEATVDFPAFYREAGTMDEFVKKLTYVGIEEDEAVAMYYELTDKYSGH